MKNNLIWLWLLMLPCILCSVQCRKTKTEIPKTELEKLPPATQTGANTFGCLVDGVAWLPNGSRPQNGGGNIVLDVDPTLQNGLFRIDGLKYNDGPGNFISINTYGCTSAGNYNFFNSSISVQYYKRIVNIICEVSTTVNNTYKQGSLYISKYDAINRIYSGTFDFILYNPQNSCGDTIKITEGRFDVKL